MLAWEKEVAFNRRQRQEAAWTPYEEMRVWRLRFVASFLLNVLLALFLVLAFLAPMSR